MSKPNIELATIFQDHGHALKGLIPDQYKVVNAIKNCRTSALGGNVLKCNSCHFKKNAYNSWRNRHCPKCQFLTRVKWIEKRKEELLPCEYFHVVFTVPANLRRVFLYNKEACYNLLFKASSETLKEVTSSPDRLGAEIGFIGILHTWSQNLIDHPHIHYVIPAGGLNKEKKKWIRGQEYYFLPVKVLARVFKGKLLKYLQELYREDKLEFYGDIEDLKSFHIFDPFIRDLSSIEWNVYAKKPFAGLEQVINYLGQYTHRMAISNYRLIKIEDGRVYFKVRDKDKVGKKKITNLDVSEFMRRFLLHVLPKGFVRIRHFGLLGNRYKKEKIKLIRELENIVELLSSEAKLSWQELLKKVTGIDIEECPKCEQGQLVAVSEVEQTLNTS